MMQRSKRQKPTATVRAPQPSHHSAYPIRTCSDNGIVCGCKWKSGLNLKHHNEPDPKLKVRKVGVLNELRETKFEHRAKCLFRRLGCLVLRNLGKLYQINSFRSM